MAALVSTWSKDPENKVGAVIVDPRNIIVSTGYNGPPQGVSDNYSTKEEKLARTLHAEENAILWARRSLQNCTLYLYPFIPCSHCAAMVIQTGIYRVVTTETEISNRWNPQVTIDMFNEARIELCQLIGDILE